MDCLYILLCRASSKADQIKENEMAEKVIGFDSQNMNKILFKKYDIDIDDYSDTYSEVPMENSNEASDMVEESIADEMKQSSFVQEPSHESIPQTEEEHYTEDDFVEEEIDDELDPKPAMASMAETPGPQ